MRDEDLVRLLEAAAEPEPTRILDALIQVTSAERGYIVMRDGVPVTRRMDGEEVGVSRTLVARAIADGRPVLASAADLAAIASVAQKVRAVLVLPLKMSGCAVYLDNGEFEPAESLARYAAALDKALARRPCGQLIGQSKAMVDLLRDLDRIAAAPYPVLIVGESGTGKELVARALHRKGPFVATSGAVFPDQLIASELFGHLKGAFTGADRDRAGLFEQANGGMLFLDEVDCLPAAAQESLLRVLETGEVRRVGAEKTEKVEVRVVAATNADLDRSDDFRRDLFYRLNVLRIDVPPLRDRRDDLPLLADHWLDRIARETGEPRKQLSMASLAAMVEYPWPGNVRELVNTLRRAAALTAGPVLEVTLPRVPAPTGGLVSIDDHIRETLLRFGGKMELTEIAEKLGVSRKTLWEKKKKWGL